MISPKACDINLFKKSLKNYVLILMGLGLFTLFGVNSLKIEPINNTAIDEESYRGYCWIFNIDKKDFLNNTKDIVRTYVKNYIKVKEYIENNK